MERVSYQNLANLPGAAYANYLKTFETAGSRLGTVGGLLALASLYDMACKAKDAYDSGDTAGMSRLVLNWTLGNVGAALLGAEAFKDLSLLLARLALLGPLGIPGALVLTIGGTLVAAALGYAGGEALGNGISDFFLAARGWLAPRRDPLVFDLDGDGIETVGINPNHPILFDHNADGVKTGTGWIGADDGFLVLDRNGNGAIDSGRELFGDATLKSNGQLAADGFAALADLDSNGDGVVDATDARFADLRIWRDLNQNGISDNGSNSAAANELFTLAELGIAGINVAATANNQVLANRNQIADLGNFIKTDGSVGTMGTAADGNLARRHFHSLFTDHIPLTAQTASLPNMSGSGLVRDLNEAATLSPALATALTALQSSNSRAEFQAQLDGVIAQWSATTVLNGPGVSLVNSFDLAESNNQNLIIVPPGVTVMEAYVASLDGLYITNGPSNLPALTEERKAEIRAATAEIKNLISVLEPFQGENFIKISNNQIEQGTLMMTASPTDPTLSSVVASVGGADLMFVGMEPARLDLLRQSYAALKQSVFDGLALQTWLKPYMDAVTLTFTAAGQLALDFSGINAKLQASIDQNPANGLVNLLELGKRSASTLGQYGWQPWELLVQNAATLPNTPEHRGQYVVQRNPKTRHRRLRMTPERRMSKYQYPGSSSLRFTQIPLHFIRASLANFLC